MSFMLPCFTDVCSFSSIVHVGAAYSLVLKLNSLLIDSFKDIFERACYTVENQHAQFNVIMSRIILVER